MEKHQDFDGENVSKTMVASSDSEQGVSHKPLDVFGNEEGHDVSIPSLDK